MSCILIVVVELFSELFKPHYRSFEKVTFFHFLLRTVDARTLPSITTYPIMQYTSSD